MDKSRLISTGLIGLSWASGVSLAQHTEIDPWFGVWVNDTPGRLFIMEPWEDAIKMISVVPETPDRPGTRGTAFVRMDGRMYPEVGNPSFDGITLNRLDDRSYEYIGSSAGTVVIRAIIHFPKDGQRRISRTLFMNGAEVDQETVWHRKRQYGPEPWYGTWENGDSRLIMQPREDGFTLIAYRVSPATGEIVREATLFARFDGKPYPLTGEIQADAFVFTRTDDRSYSVAHMRDGRQLGVENVTLTGDGTRRMVEWTVTDESETQLRSFEWLRLE